MKETEREGEGEKFNERESAALKGYIISIPTYVL